MKIRLELKKHRVSEYCIGRALEQFSDDEYETTLVRVLQKKLSITGGSDRRKKYYQVLNYAVSRGFESQLVNEYLNKMTGERKNESGI